MIYSSKCSTLCSRGINRTVAFALAFVKTMGFLTLLLRFVSLTYTSSFCCECFSSTITIMNAELVNSNWEKLTYKDDSQLQIHISSFSKFSKCNFTILSLVLLLSNISEMLMKWAWDQTGFGPQIFSEAVSWPRAAADYHMSCLRPYTRDPYVLRSLCEADFIMSSSAPSVFYSDINPFQHGWFECSLQFFHL